MAGGPANQRLASRSAPETRISLAILLSRSSVGIEDVPTYYEEVINALLC